MGGDGQSWIWHCNKLDIRTEFSALGDPLDVQGNLNMADDTRAAFKHILTEGNEVMDKLAKAGVGH